MPGPFLFDRVKESSTTTGTGNFTLSGTAATGGYRRFQDVLSTNDFTYYTIQNTGSNEFEVGVGQLTAATTLVRTQVISSSNSNSAVNFSAGTKDVWIDTPATCAMPTPPNYIINDFSVAQRQVATTVTTIPADSYGPDRWRCHRENADLQFNVVSDSSGGGHAKFAGEFKKITNAGKILICQPIENNDTCALRSIPVTFQARLSTSTNRTIKIALVEWQGVPDATTAAMVSAWNGASVDPTLATSYSTLATTTCSCTSTPTTFAVTATPSVATCSNLCCVIWSDTQFSATDTIDISDPACYAAAGMQVYSPEPAWRVREACYRFFYAIVVSSGSAKINHGLKISGTQLDFPVAFPAQMRAEPTLVHNITGYTASTSPGTTTVGVFDSVAGAAVTITGALTPSVLAPSLSQGVLRLTAGTSWSGTNGSGEDLRFGPNVIVGFSAEI